ncbi:putative sugar efflux transporter [Gluconacetobacter sp. SXCC-1]|uniref:MFS transporter n=1 Tax=Komagataeibacter rhaeticus TaxID=215221 RepID=A0A181CA77_9PROT|nr:MFS transporter [Komagataeibacter rhaeticus]ATU72981.1 MFS transporter [Komagataeibacter xylinus]EGG77229.1 putative sugar efflux transporter [Gluconacetobacter sp. SXCC-1]QIP35275.1 MFS transporter [Komagataeibacter rhaeticus]QOC47839.1 MFS transporter [Komagataeibacter rhaeticus]WPP22794.1 MFS transporter [Komagataeibacter rhaeticus]
MLFKSLPAGAVIGLWALFACTFTALTSEVAPVGILIDMAHAFHIMEGQAGLAVSAFALLVALGAVPLTILTAHIDRKRLMVLSLSGYVLSNLVVAIAPTFVLVCVGRMIGGVAHALLMSIVSAYAARLVPQAMTGRAISFVYGGTSLGAVLGVPGMAAAGQLVGWRMAMFILTGLSLVLTLCIAFFLPPVSTPVHVRESLPAMRSRRVMRIFMVVVVVDGVFFIAHNLLYTYVTPLLLDHGVAAGALSLALLLTGGISILGLWGAGHLVDRNPAMGVLAGGLAMLVGMGLIYGHIVSGWVAVAAVGLWCIGYSGLIPFVMSGAIRARATRPDVAGAAINAASNVGILLGSAVGGRVLTVYGFGVLTPLSIAIVVCGLVLALGNPAAFPHALPASAQED